MKEGINDRTLAKMMGLQHRAISKIREMVEGDKPFAAEKQDPQKLIDAVNSLGYMDLPQLVTEFGPEAVNRLVYDVKMLEMRRQR